MAEGSADKILSFVTVMSTSSGISLQPFLSVMILKTMVGMFRNTLRHAATVTLIKTIGTILHKIMSRIYKNSTALCFMSDPYTIAILKM
jgi:hypothetical protein